MIKPSHEYWNCWHSAQSVSDTGILNYSVEGSTKPLFKFLGIVSALFARGKAITRYTSASFLLRSNGDVGSAILRFYSPSVIVPNETWAPHNSTLSQCFLHRLVYDCVAAAVIWSLITICNGRNIRCLSFLSFRNIVIIHNLEK